MILSKLLFYALSALLSIIVMAHVLNRPAVKYRFLINDRVDRAVSILVFGLAAALCLYIAIKPI